MSEMLSLWLPGVAAAVVGLFGGLAAALAASRREATGPDPVLLLEELQQRKEHLIEQLRELAQQRHRMTRQAYEEQRAELERRAAEALRAREALLVESGKPAQTRPRGRKPATPATPAVSYLQAHPRLRLLLWTGGSAAVLLLAGLFVAGEAGAPAAGTAPPSAAPAMSPELAAVMKRIEANPADVDALVAGADILLRDGRPAEANRFVERALQLDPERTDALVQLAWLQLLGGEPDVARHRIDDVLQHHPDLVEAWWVRGRIGMESGDAALARESFERYLALAPDGPQKQAVLKVLHDEMGGATPAPDPRTGSP